MWKPLWVHSVTPSQLWTVETLLRAGGRKYKELEIQDQSRKKPSAPQIYPVTPMTLGRLVTKQKLRNTFWNMLVHSIHIIRETPESDED